MAHENCGRVNAWVNCLNLREIDRLEAENAELRDGLLTILEYAHEDYERSEQAVLLDIIGLCNSYLTSGIGKENP